jgi:hypothetical protein
MRIQQSICSIGSLNRLASIYLSSFSNRSKEQRPIRHCAKVASRLVHITRRNSALLARVRCSPYLVGEQTWQSVRSRSRIARRSLASYDLLVEHGKASGRNRVPIVCRLAPEGCHARDGSLGLQKAGGGIRHNDCTSPQRSTMGWSRQTSSST